MEQEVSLPDDFEGYDSPLFCIPEQYAGDVKRIWVPHGMIMDRIAKLAQIIRADLGSEDLCTLCVLKGGFRFYSDLMQKFQEISAISNKAMNVSMDFIRLKSYSDGDSTGNVQVFGGENLAELKGKTVLVVEDMIDTGRTMVALLDLLKKYEPKQIKVACLLVKRTARSNGYLPDYCGFKVPDQFIVGYSIDYNEHFRDLNHICYVNKEVMEKYKSTKKKDTL